MAAGAGNTRKSLRRLGFELTAVSGARYGSGQEHAETKEPIPGQYVQRVKHGGPLPGEKSCEYPGMLAGSIRRATVNSTKWTLVVTPAHRIMKPSADKLYILASRGA